MEEDDEGDHAAGQLPAEPSFLRHRHRRRVLSDDVYPTFDRAMQQKSKGEGREGPMADKKGDAPWATPPAGARGKPGCRLLVAHLSPIAVLTVSVCVWLEFLGPGRVEVMWLRLFPPFPLNPCFSPSRSVRGSQFSG